jgi:starch synthase
MWHMHQPYYRDDLTDTFLLPWVRLRCAKDYLKMAAILDRYPNIRQTFNLVPSLVEQIQAYASGTFTDTYLEMSRRPVSDLAEEERAFIARWMTESSGIPRVRQFPRYLELVSKREAASGGDFARLFDDQELLDLQVWFNLAWVAPETISAKPELAELVRRGRNFGEIDKEPIFRAQLDAIKAVIPAYRQLQDRRQVELVTSPYFHPIMPLISDLRVATESRPQISLPERWYRHPEDVDEQLRMAVQAHAKVFGHKPAGLWPPEAALSDEVLKAVSRAGIGWVVSDEAILAHSLHVSLDRDGQGVPVDSDLLYRPFRVPGLRQLKLLFRDARLSNLIGFEYQGYEAKHAADDLVGRLLAIQARHSSDSKPRLVTIALDGENCWDFYPENGNRFLDALYQRLESEPLLKTVTISEFVDSYEGESSVPHIYPGSWIDASLDTWVGDQEHNQAWEMLEDARRAMVEGPSAAADGGRARLVKQARRELLIAEGSDWFWWFGRAHDSGMDAVWDNLFRLHLRNAYQSLGKPIPGNLFQPVAKQPENRASKRPERKITPSLNGSLDEAEWQAAGYFDATALFGAMHPPKGVVKRIWFGHDDERLYLRLDLRPQASGRRSLEIRLGADGREAEQTLRVREEASGWELELNGGSRQRPAWETRLSSGNTVAFGLPFAALNRPSGETLHLSLSAQGTSGLEQLPPSGTLKIRVPGDSSSRASRPLKILVVSAEVAPFAKVGGLADVAGALPKALRALGHDVRVVMPRYGSIDRERYQFRRILTGLNVQLAQQSIEADVFEGRIGDQVPLYLIDNDQFFGREGMYGFWDDDARFIYFSRAALQMLQPIGFQPDVIHVNDWHTAIIPNMLDKLYRPSPFYGQIASVLTIHNLAFQGVFGYGALHLANLDPWGLIRPGITGLDDTVNLLGRGLYFADMVNTVSRRYAEEILTPEFGEGMDPLLRMFEHKLSGIINGIDYDVFNPASDRMIVSRYDGDSLDRKVENKLALQREVGLPEDAGVPVLGLISRLYDQKGLDLVSNIMWGLTRLNLQLVVLGAGEPRYEEMFRNAARENSQKVSATIGFKPVLAQHIYAGSDMFLMPSRFEPCGLGQLISLRYGTIPIVRATGGLADTIQDWDPVAGAGNGFVFSAYDHWDLYAQVVRALENFRQPQLWRRLQHNAMSTDVSWNRSAEEYVGLYRSAIRSREEASEYVAVTSSSDPW